MAVGSKDCDRVPCLFQIPGSRRAGTIIVPVRLDCSYQKLCETNLLCAVAHGKLVPTYFFFHITSAYSRATRTTRNTDDDRLKWTDWTRLRNPVVSYCSSSRPYHEQSSPSALHWSLRRIDWLLAFPDLIFDRFAILKPQLSRPETHRQFFSNSTVVTHPVLYPVHWLRRPRHTPA